MAGGYLRIVPTAVIAENCCSEKSIAKFLGDY
jgi:hypothetical protein